MNPSSPSDSVGMMNRTDVMVAVVNMAELGGAFPADEAISHIAAMIDRLDVLSDTYQRDAALLLGIGATIWTLAKAGFRIVKAGASAAANSTSASSPIEPAIRVGKCKDVPTSTMIPRPRPCSAQIARAKRTISLAADRPPLVAMLKVAEFAS